MSTTNDSVPFFAPGDEVTGRAAGAITGSRFVKLNGTPMHEGRPVFAPAGADPGVPLAVAATDAADGADFLVYTGGQVASVTAGAALNAGDPITSNASGKAVVATTGALAAGTVWDDVADGDAAPVKLDSYLVP